MKAFEKWYLPDKDIYVNEYELQKEAWKAALEWARDNAGGGSSDSRDVWGDIVKELEQ